MTVDDPAVLTLHDLAVTSAQVDASAGRNDKIAALADRLRGLPAEQAALAVSYLAGRLPQGRIGVGPAAVQGIDATPSDDPSLTVEELDDALSRIGAVSGTGSTAERARLLTRLFSRTTAEGQRFLRRLLVGELRQGAAEGVMLDAVARAADVKPKRLRRAVMFAGKPETVMWALIQRGPDALLEFDVRLFRPLKPMLAQTAESAAEALERLGEASFEHKLDGVRIQLHKSGEDVRIYTRKLRDETASVPDLVEWARGLAVDDAILDGEAITLADGRPLPFQETGRRFGARVKHPERLARALPLTPFFFDCLYLNGRSLIDEDGVTRWSALETAVPGTHRVERTVTADPEAAELFFSRALEAGQEGVMAKDPTVPYVAGRRGRAWLKVKPVRTADLVVLGAEWGHGRRKGWLSNLHLGARDPETGEFVMVGKTFKGLTDQLLAWQTERILSLATERRGHVVIARPEQVVEIAYDGVQRSSRYPGGVALRFARVRSYREDKGAEAADTIGSLQAQLS